jgi:hypothetical protein
MAEIHPLPPHANPSRRRHHSVVWRALHRLSDVYCLPGGHGKHSRAELTQINACKRHLR